MPILSGLIEQILRADLDRELPKRRIQLAGSFSGRLTLAIRPRWQRLAEESIPEARQCFAILRFEKFRLRGKTKMRIEFADNFPRKLDVRYLVFTDWHEKFLSWLAV